MYNNFFNPLFVSSDITLIQNMFKNSLKQAMEVQSEQNVKAVTTLIRCLNFALDIPPFANELFHNFNIQNMLEMTQVKLGKFITNEHGNEIQILLQKVQNEHRPLSPYNILDLIQAQAEQEELVQILIRLLRIQLLYFDVNRTSAYDYYFFFKGKEADKQQWEAFLRSLIKIISTLSKEYQERILDILTFLNRQSQELTDILVNLNILGVALEYCGNPQFAKRGLILFRDLLETNSDADQIIDVPDTVQKMFQILKGVKDNRHLVMLISQIVTKLELRNLAADEDTSLPTQDMSQMAQNQIEEMIDGICFKLLTSDLDYDPKFFEQLIKILQAEHQTENLLISSGFLIEKFLKEMDPNQRAATNEVCHFIALNNPDNQRVTSQYLGLLKLMSTSFKLQIKFDFLDRMREVHADNVKILRQLDELQRKKKKKFNKLSNQDFESIESFTSFSMERSMSLKKSRTGTGIFARSEQDENELDQVLKLTLSKDNLIIVIDCLKYLTEAQKVNQDIVLQYLEQTIDVFLLYPTEKLVREMTLHLLETINPQEYIISMLQDMEFYDDQTLKLLAGLSLYPQHFDQQTIERILNFILQFIIIKTEGNQINHILTIAFNLKLKQPQLIQYISNLINSEKVTRKGLILAHWILAQHQQRIDAAPLLRDSIVTKYTALLDALHADLYYAEDVLLLEAQCELLAVQDLPEFFDIMLQLLRYVQYEEVSTERRLTVFKVVRALVLKQLQLDANHFLRYTPFLPTSHYILRTLHDCNSLCGNVLFIDRFSNYMSILAAVLNALPNEPLLQEFMLSEILTKFLVESVEACLLSGENKMLLPYLQFIYLICPGSLVQHVEVIDQVQRVVHYSIEQLVSTQILVIIWKILILLFDQNQDVDYYKQKYGNASKLAEIGFTREKELSDLTVVLLKKIVVDQNQIETLQQQANEQLVVQEVVEEQEVEQAVKREEYYSAMKEDDQGDVWRQNDQAVIDALIVEQMEKQQKEENMVREEERDVRSEERREDALLGVVVEENRRERREDQRIGEEEREIRNEDRRDLGREERRDLGRDERREDQIIRDEERDARGEERREIRREERREDVLIGAVVEENRRERREEERMVEDQRQIERQERNAVAAGAIVEEQRAYQQEPQDYQGQQNYQQQPVNNQSQAYAQSSAAVGEQVYVQQQQSSYVQQQEYSQQQYQDKLIRKEERHERTEEALLAAVLIEERETRKQMERKEERIERDNREQRKDIERIERRQEAMVVASAEVRREEKKELREERREDKVQREDQKELNQAIKVDGQAAQNVERQEDLRPSQNLGEATISRDQDWQFKNLLDISEALNFMIGDAKYQERFPQVSMAIQRLIINEQQALNSHQLNILNKLLNLNQTINATDSICWILQFKRSAKLSENNIQWQLIKINEINVNVIKILKLCNRINQMVMRLVAKKEIILLINNLETSDNVSIIKIIFECLDAYCINEKVANFYQQYNIMGFIEKWYLQAPAEVALLIGSLCLNQKLQQHFIEQQYHIKIQQSLMQLNAIQLQANSFYALSALCFGAKQIQAQVCNQGLSTLMFNLISAPILESVVLETLCSFISNVVYQNEKLKINFFQFIAKLIVQLQKQSKVNVIRQVLRALANLIYVRQNANIAIQNNILQVVGGLIENRILLSDIMDIYCNLAAHQLLPADKLNLILRIVKQNQDEDQIVLSGLDALNALVKQQSSQIAEYIDLITTIATTSKSNHIVHRSYRLLCNLIPRNFSLFKQKNILAQLRPYNIKQIDYYYYRMISFVKEQTVPKAAPPTILENPYDRLAHGYPILLYNSDGSAGYADLKILPTKEVYAVAVDGVIRPQNRIRYLQEINFNVQKNIPEYRKCLPNELFKGVLFFTLRGRYEGGVNSILGQAMSENQKKELYEVLSMIFK